MFQIIAIASLKKGEAENFKKLIPAIVSASKADKGNVSYQCDQDALNPDVFIFQERWESDAALDAHLASRTSKSLLPRSSRSSPLRSPCTKSCSEKVLCPASQRLSAFETPFL